jgi:hypothetical protein
MGHRQAGGAARDLALASCRTCDVGVLRFRGLDDGDRCERGEDQAESEDRADGFY